jgi:hypothetical protein
MEECMTIGYVYKCNVCDTPINAKSGVGFVFKSGGLEFEHGSPESLENHLCYQCIAAIYDLSDRIYPYNPQPEQANTTKPKVNAE